MNKKLIALALAALPAVAMADVTMYGIMKLGVENTSWKMGKGGDRHSQNRIDDYGSRIGVKGSEDLGDGLKAIWQVESAVRLDGDQDVTGEGSTFKTRDSFVGLDFGDFGKIRFGRLSTQLNDPLSIVDIWEYDTGANGLNVFTRTGIRLNNAVRYDSPDWAGFNFNLIYGTYEKKGSDPASSHVAWTGVEKGNGVAYRNGYVGGVGLNYQNSGFFVSYGYEYHSDNFATRNGSQDPAWGWTGDERAKWSNGYVHRVELGYNANNLFLGLGYQQTKLGGGWALEDSQNNKILEYVGDYQGVKTQEIAFSAAYTIGQFTPKFSYAHGWDMKSADNGNGKLKNTKYDQFVVGVDYALSKRTIAGLAWGQLKMGRGGQYEYDYTDIWGNDHDSFSSNGKATQRTIGLSLLHKF